MKIISWNINGIRSNIVDFTTSKNKKSRILDKGSALGFIIKKYNPDIICFQETRLGENNYHLYTDKSITSIYPYQYWSSSKKTGARSGNRYSGTSIWSKIEANKQVYEIPGLDNLEGRFIQLQFNNVVLINTYTPNAGSNWEYRLEKWEPAINKHIKKLIKSGKDVIYCGDNNIANKNDVWFGELLDKKLLIETNKDANSDIAKKLKRLVKSKQKFHTGEKILTGYSKEEREAYSQLITNNNLIDCYRHLNPNIIDKFTWFNVRIPKSIETNKGWLIDRFLIQNKNKKKIIDCSILSDLGIYYKNTFISDHLPIFLNINFK